ncbi:MAG TPA: lysine--tRNA ligase [Candidatus Dormibacteraeota bacterium]|nr:lysine--tRNA ligase [Candidatus Dormibacteraeota bacterium]
MTNLTDSKYWLDVTAEEIIKRYPKGEVIVSSGISPSASYHIGHYREIITADALAWAVRERGRKARHIHVVDNFDPLRKRYDFLPKKYEKYVGWPICLVPDPNGDCHKSYAEHFFGEFQQYFEPMGIKAEVVRSYEELYKTGRMTSYIEKVIQHVQEIKGIFEKLANRSLPKDWLPVSLIGENNKLIRATKDSWDQTAKTLGGIKYDDGRAKLDWRLDWPARWAELGVDVEPFGMQEHGAAGGSYETGAEFCRHIFGAEPPYDAGRYGHIHLAGEAKKMSSSYGKIITPKEALEIMPPEILRYFIVRSRPEKKLQFDSGIGLANLIDEFAAAGSDEGHEFRDAYEFAVAGNKDQVISTIPFKHLVSVYQAAKRDEPETLEILRRTDYEEAVKAEADVIKRELKFAGNWLNKYAPEEIKLELQEKMPKIDLSSGQKQFLTKLADLVEAKKAASGQDMHELIYQAKDEADLAPQEAFQAIYRVILGKDYGPKAGWFLASLDSKWLVGRLRFEA